MTAHVAPPEKVMVQIKVMFAVQDLLSILFDLLSVPRAAKLSPPFSTAMTIRSIQTGSRVFQTNVAYTYFHIHIYVHDQLH